LEKLPPPRLSRDVVERIFEEIPGLLPELRQWSQPDAS
jgi:hypothetical protein